ncbi:MAG: hypothetical protein FWH12_09570 [Treponema sp.]|nr:hypothetical protein [Treponema sp.]
MRALGGLVYQAVPAFEDHLAKELEGSPQVESHGLLYHAPASIAEDPVFWHHNVWLDPFSFEFDSISQAASALREIQGNWAPQFFTSYRRGALICEKLPKVPNKKRPFPFMVPPVPMGAFSLLDDHTLIGSARCTSPFPGGLIEFIEDPRPPSRAYLKLYEALVRLGRFPGPGDLCLDAGASPGGWTWVLASMGARVIAVDRSPLDEVVAAMEGVEYVKHDAFTLKPHDLGPVDWLFCDVISYPPRLFDWIEAWLASGLCKNFVCTIKMQGQAGGTADFESPRRFAAIPGSAVIHLCYNKHELCWMLPGPGLS